MGGDDDQNMFLCFFLPYCTANSIIEFCYCARLSIVLILLYKSHSFIVLFQFLIFVIDSTDRERLHISKSELYNMLSQEVSQVEIYVLYGSLLVLIFQTLHPHL